MATTPLRTFAALLLPLALLAACSDDDAAAPVVPAGCRGQELDGESLLDCIGPSLALVETPIAAGSGVLLADGYVVTNAHVVDPYGSADVTFPAGGPILEDVPVVGIDAYADIAVLGPLEDPAPTALGLVTGGEVARGADVYLLGYPGEAEAEPEPTISRGVLSRTREAGDFDLTYLQTDASIGGGQSGGALVDGDGRLIGISGLSFAEQFALALDGADVQAAVDRIIAGDGDAYASIPEGEGSMEHTQRLVDELDGRPLVFAAEDRERTVQITLDPPDLPLVGLAVDYEPLLVNQAAFDAVGALADVSEEDFGIDPADPIAPGTWEMEIPADVEAVVQVTAPTADPVDVTIRTSEPTVEIPISERGSITLGTTIEGTIDYFETYDVYTLELQAGDEVDVTVKSAQGDMSVSVRAPGESALDMEEFDDGGGGLYDTDGAGTYTAEADGTYVFAVQGYDGVVTGYRLTVTEAEAEAD